MHLDAVIDQNLGSSRRALRPSSPFFHPACSNTSARISSTSFGQASQPPHALSQDLPAWKWSCGVGLPGNTGSIHACRARLATMAV